MLHSCLGHILKVWGRCCTSALFAGLTQNKLPCRAVSGNRPAAAASNAVSADVPSTDRTAPEPTVPAVATQNATDAPKAPDLSSPLQAQEQTSLAKCEPKAPIALPDVVITASKPTKQASSCKSSFFIPSSCKPPPSSAAKHALTPFGKSQSKMVFRTTTSSPLSAPAFKAANAPPGSACQSCIGTSSTSSKEHCCASRHKGCHHLTKPAQQHQAAYCAGLGRIDSEAEQPSYISEHWQTQGCRQQRGTCSSGTIQVQQPACASVKTCQC